MENVENLFLNCRNEELNSLKIGYNRIFKDEKQKIFIHKLDLMIQKYYKTFTQKPKL